MIKLQRILIETRPVKALINWSKKLVLPGFESLPLYDVLHFFFKQTQQIGLNERAASVSFNFLMAIPPLFIFIFTLLSYIPGSKRLYEEVLVLLLLMQSYVILRSLLLHKNTNSQFSWLLKRHLLMR